MKKLLAIILLSVFIFFPQKKFFLAQETESDIQKKIEEYQNKLKEIQQQKNTLASQIQYMDTQIYLTQLKMIETEEKIEKTQKEIETLGERIDNLDQSLTFLTKTMLKKVVESYKKRSVSFLDYLLNENQISYLLARIKYLKTSRDNTQKLIIQVQKTKLNFEEQKQLREEKIVQLDQLKTILEKQKQELAYQKSAKQKLLADTQNDENVYQELLARAQRQLAAFKSFVQTSGAASPIAANGLGTGSDGNYFSQRDERWAYKTIGYSQENILNVGCLITSVAMSLKKRGVDTNPLIIASNPDYFEANTAYMKYRWNIGWPNGLRGYQISTSQVDDELNQGNYVIVGINYGACRYGLSDHFVVLTKKEGGDYKMHDPLWGPDLNFYSKYNAICWAEVIK